MHLNRDAANKIDKLPGEDGSIPLVDVRFARGRE